MIRSIKRRFLRRPHKSKEISALVLTLKSSGFLQSFVAFSEYMKFNSCIKLLINLILTFTFHCWKQKKNVRNGIILGSLLDEMMPSSSQRLGLNSFVNCRLWDSNLDGEKFKRWRLWRSSHKSVPKSRAQLDSRTSGLGPTASLWWYRVIANSKRKCRTSHVASIQRVLKKEIKFEFQYFGSNKHRFASSPILHSLSNSSDGRLADLDDFLG